MRIILRFCNNSRLIGIPQHYNHLVQAAIYSSISPSLSHFLHEKGFMYGKRAFKMFTFSRLLGRHRREGDNLIFEGDITLYLSSPIERFIKEIANTIVKRGFFKIGSSELSVAGLKFPEEPKISREMKIRTLSPITVYSTLFTQNGRKKTYYYSPYEEEFSRLINENLKKKFYLLNKRKIKSSIDVTPIKVRECIVMYKDTVIRGWYGVFSIKGSISLMRIAYETGLGTKNPEGFGMFEVI
jgi:CRISPR-associated endoribonuclease Cas6